MSAFLFKKTALSLTNNKEKREKKKRRRREEEKKVIKTMIIIIIIIIIIIKHKIKHIIVPSTQFMEYESCL